jgi:very-short-patch-repair endonuclease
MSIDDDVVRLAERRHHLARVTELLELGLTHRQIRRRIAQSRLFRVHHSVVSTVPPPYSFEARAVAACLAVPTGVVSHSAAAYVHHIRRSPRELLDLTVRTGSYVELEGVHVHRSKALHECDVQQWINGMRLTTPARSLFDLAAVLDGPALRSAVEDARNRGIVTDLELDDVGARLIAPGRPGSAMFREVVDPLLGSTPTQSGYEVTVRDALMEAGLEPIPQHPLRLPNGRRIFMDLALVDSRIDVEIDPALTHVSRAAVAADKARDVQVALSGWVSLRFTEDDVTDRLRSLVGYVRAMHHRRLAA